MSSTPITAPLTRVQYLALLEAEYLQVATNNTFALTSQSMAILADIFTQRSRNKRFLLNFINKLNNTQFSTLWPLIKDKVKNGFIILVPFNTAYFPVADNVDFLKRLSKVALSPYYSSNWNFRNKTLLTKIDIGLVAKLPAIGRFKALYQLKDCASNPFTDCFTQQEFSDLLFAATFGAKNSKYQKQVSDLIKNWQWYK